MKMNSTQNMSTEKDIKSAIDRSVSNTETVRVTVADIPAALADIYSYVEDYDSTATNEGEDVWGTTEDGSEFRLLLVPSAP